MGHAETTVMICSHAAAKNHVATLSERLKREKIIITYREWEPNECFATANENERDAFRTADRIVIIFDYQLSQQMKICPASKPLPLDHCPFSDPEIQNKLIAVIVQTSSSQAACLPSCIRTDSLVDMSVPGIAYEAAVSRVKRMIGAAHSVEQEETKAESETLHTRIIPDYNRFYYQIDRIKRSAADRSAAAYYIQSAIGECIGGLKEIHACHEVGNRLQYQIEAATSLRDLYLDLLETVIFFRQPIAKTVTDFMESLYNESRNTRLHSDYPVQQDNSFFDFFLWEAFLCSSATLLYYEKYQALHDILNHTYLLEERIGRRKSATPHKYTYFSNLLTERYDFPHNFPASTLSLNEKEPIITRSSFAKTDAVLAQLSNVYDLYPEYHDYWVPSAYRTDSADLIDFWQNLKSASYCEKIKPLFGSDSADGIREIVANSRTDKPISPMGCNCTVPPLSECIHCELIASDE